MKILGVTTSTEKCSVAVWDDGRVLAETSFPGARSCVEVLMPSITRLLNEAGVAAKQLDRLAVDVGPGGLTGVKIGVVTIKTLGQVHGLAVCGVSTTKALCSAAPGGYDAYVAVMKCMKNEFFSALYISEGGSRELVGKEQLGLMDRVQHLIEQSPGKGPGKVLVLGDAACRVGEELPELLGSKFELAPEQYNYPVARIVCEEASTMTPGGYETIVPNYLCLSNAERNFGIKL